jgi:hypothetical protein
MAELSDALERQIDEAMTTGRDYHDNEVATSVRYVREIDCFLLVLRSGVRLAIPREEMQDVAALSPEQAARVALAEEGTVVEWAEPNIDFSVVALAQGLRGNERWMQRLAERRSPAYAA